MKCLSCNNTGVTLHTIKGYPVTTVHHTGFAIARACNLCKRGKLVKKLNLLESLKYRSIRTSRTTYTAEVLKIRKQVSSMEIKNDRL